MKTLSEDLVRDLRKAAKSLGDNFTAEQYRNAGGDYNPKMISKRFGGWDEALKQIHSKKIKDVEGKETKEQKDHFSENLLNALQKQSTITDLANTVDTAPKKVLDEINKLRKLGVEIKERDGEFWVEIADVTRPQDKEYKHTVTTKIGLVSDTHLGSKEQQLTHLHDFYNRCAREKIDTVFHIGDVFAGNGHVYRGQTYDLFINGIDDVLEYATKNYPKIPGIKTKFITGNHDLSWYKTSGIDIGVQLAQCRPDMEYLGQLGAYVFFNNIKAYFMHPTGGRSYAHSYKPQKFVEGFSSQNKPQLFLIGHYHSAGFFYTRNVHTFMVPCFEGQTSLFVANGWMPEVGGWILDLNVDKTNTIYSINQEYVSYPKLAKHDY